MQKTNTILKNRLHQGLRHCTICYDALQKYQRTQQKKAIYLDFLIDCLWFLVTVAILGLFFGLAYGLAKN